MIFKADAGAVSTHKPSRSVEPDSVTLHMSLGNASLLQGDIVNAAASYGHVVSLRPTHGEARIKLAHALKLNGDYTAAAAILHALAVDHPNDPAVPKEFGRLYFMQHHLDDALESFRRVVRLNPSDADAYHWLANIEHLKGHTEAAREHYRRTVALKPITRLPARKMPPDFSALFLFSPGHANTPPDTLVKAADYESRFLLLLPDTEYDAGSLQSDVQLVVNLISDGDQGREILLAAEALIARVNRPVVNHPRAILKTDRASTACLLSGIPFCHVPQVRRYNAETVPDHVGVLNWQFPLLMRVVGTHGGESFEKLDDIASINQFVGRHPGEDFYLTDYVDYKSEDGFFRKYRFFFVDDEILPYHLAIGDTWKLHHVTTDMANQPWMQREEEAFLNNPASVFYPRHFSALRSIRQAIGLDFFGIDCAIGPDGHLVVFEVNASMLVHQDNGLFPYKTLAVHRIKSAFDAMLRRKATLT